MPPMAETKTGAPNIQDVFLNYARREKLAVVRPPARWPRVRSAHQELRSLRADRRAQRDGSPDVQARHRDDPHAAQRSELLLIASSLTPRCSVAPSSSCSTVSASANCRMPRCTATRAATRSATSPTSAPLNIPTLAALGLSRGLAPRCPVPRRRRERRTGGWPNARAGKDSVTGHWELMGVVLDRAVPDVSARVSSGADRRLRAAHRPRLDRQRRRLGHGDHRRSSGRRTWRPALRSSTPRPTACSRSPRTRMSCRCRQLYEWCEAAYELAVEGDGPRPRDRAAVRRTPGSFTPHRQPPRLRDAADRRDAARRADRERSPGDGGRQDQRPVRRARASASRYPTTSDADGMDVLEARMATQDSRAAVRQPRRLRHALRPSQRRRRATPRTSSDSMRG